MKASVLTFTILIFLLNAAHVAFGQAAIESITNKNFLNGYAGKIAEENIGYHSFHPYATDALLTRVTDGTMALAWLTDTIPATYKGDEVYFGWIAGYSCGTSSAYRHLDLYINDEKVLPLTRICNPCLLSQGIFNPFLSDPGSSVGALVRLP
jgi:hypothetical protein